MSTVATKEKFDINKLVTDQIIAMIEKAIATGENLTWKKMWETTSPKSYSTGKAYRGINAWLLAFSEYKSNYWITWDQCQKIGGKVKETEAKNYRYAIFWKFLQGEAKGKNGEVKRNKNGETMIRSFPIMRYYRVYNLDQCEIPENKMPKNDNIVHVHDTISEAEAVIANYKNGPEIKFSGDRACYCPSSDTVTMPIKEKFVNAEGYYCTFFHELIHSTGNEKRLDRVLEMGRENYSKEELIAELGASMLAAQCGIKADMENSAAYLKSWLKPLQNDVKLIVSAAQSAQKAVDLILGVTYEKAPDVPATETADSE